MPSPAQPKPESQLMTIFSVIMLIFFVFILGTTNRYGPQIIWMIALFAVTIIGSLVLL